MHRSQNLAQIRVIDRNLKSQNLAPLRGAKKKLFSKNRGGGVILIEILTGKGTSSS